MRRILAMTMAIALSAVVPGCVVHGRGYGHGHLHTDVEVTVPLVHVHDSYCGHYWHGGVWYYRTGHHHGPGCGHLFTGGRWCRH